MKWRSISSVTSKSAITPSLSGRIALIVPGVRPSMRLASMPTACTSPVRWSIATTEGSERTMPRPRTYTSVLAVPRSTAMSRPPKPLIERKMPIRAVTLAALLAEAVGPGEALGEHADEQRGRKPDDVQVIALDPLDERAAPPLDRVGARPSLPLSVREMARELPRRQLPEGDVRRLVLDHLPARRDQAEAGHHGVRLAGQLLEHPLRVGRVGGLAVHAAVEPDGGVDAEHGPIAGQVR